ncbi:MAG TPA: DUF2950 domain-containing protein [Terriglobales bacterium]|nr:DUF2950 domain-containing protein [Terriglobales bacterium]
MLALALVASLASCSKRETKAETATGKTAQRTFASPVAAGDALFTAAKSGDQDALMAIFGSEGKDILFSGDAVKDKNTAQRFVNAYSRMNRWSKTASGEEILYVGADNFAFPIPLDQNASGQWAFNTAAGKDEVLARRIGDGELTAIGVLTEIANAQQEYFSQNHQFAQKFVSDEGQSNGLYWPVAQGQRPSPLGPLGDVAKALGYSHTDRPQPFNGYYYKMLTQQGDTAKGGAKDYLRDGKLTGGFAVLAWPARYRDSGIMAFLVGNDGIIYEKDLGEKTSDAAGSIESYNPGEGWKVVLAPESPRGNKVNPANTLTYRKKSRFPKEKREHAQAAFDR